MSNPLFAEMDAALEGEIARRPAHVRLPHKGGRFRALRETHADLVTWMRLAHLEGMQLPIDVEACLVPAGEVLRLDYEPDPAKSTHCTLVPERYQELESRLVAARWRAEGDYSGYGLSIAYLSLDADFEGL